MGEQAKLNDKGGFNDLIVSVMDETDDEDGSDDLPAAAAPLVPASLLLEMGSGGWTTGI